MADTETAEPRQDQARRLVLSIAGFWCLGAVSVQVPFPARLVPHLAAMACGFVFFYGLAQIAAENMALRPLDLWKGIPGNRDVSPRDSWRLTGGLLRPTWWRRTIRATGWPAALVGVALALALVACLASIATSLPT